MNAPAIPVITPKLDWPAEGVTRVPYRVYTDPDLYALEQERIFRGAAWNFLGLAVEVPNPGDFKATFVGDTPVVLTRDHDGALHAWVNRCAHRGALVCRELRGNVGASGTHTCVYHQWAYDAGGNLVGVPFRRGLGGKGGYLVDGMELTMLMYRGKALDLDLPASVVLQVTHTEPGVKGDTVSGATKPATLSTGITVNVPLFVNEGEKIKVDTRSGDYLGRV